MIINPDILRKETVALIKQIDAQINEVTQEAALKGIGPEKLRDGVGNWVMGPLLLAKAQAYATLVALQVPKK
jgi:hypothetical protein